ncbi:MFS general substrate transporter [Mycena galericulata]|nr:MFS general substrate transporter [Mycena galericulata]
MRTRAKVSNPTPTMADRSSPHSSTINEPDEESGAASYLDIEPPGEKAELDPYLIDSFEEGDPANPKNWSKAKRWYLTALSGMLVLNATFASAAPSGIAVQLMDAYHLSEELATLAISLFVAGYCVGPLLWGPLSEQYGRRPLFIYPFAVYTLFQVGAALSKNGASILVFRFLGGVFAASPLSNSGAILADIWDSNERGKAMAMFTLAPFAGPTLGPTIAGFIATTGTDFRWVFWVMALFAGTCCLLTILTLPETYAPIIYVRMAEKKRLETGDDAWKAPLEITTFSFLERAENVVARPFKVLFQEPMLLAITVYMSFVYGCLYINFEAYPIVFTEGHHLNAGISGLMFLPIMLGGAVAVTISVLVFNPRYEREAARLAPHAVPPEFRLEMALFAAPIYAVAFFWFGWTSFPSVSLWAPLMSGLAMGFAISWIFLSFFNYIIDTYLFVAASALAASTVVRSIFGAVFPLFATQMFNALGPRWASSLLGFVALAMVPIPIILKRFGPTLRAKSKHAPAKPTPRPAKLEVQT